MHPRVTPKVTNFPPKSAWRRSPSISSNPVSRAFADHDTDREGFLHPRAFIAINLPPLARVDRRGSTLLLSLANRATGVFSY
jgi:hypothetical protein